MSRSYKKHSYCGSNTKSYKRLANKAVRRRKDVSDGKFFRKIWCSYDICDYGHILFKSDGKIYDQYRRK